MTVHCYRTLWRQWKDIKLCSLNTAYPEQSLALQLHHHQRKQQRMTISHIRSKDLLYQKPFSLSPHTYCWTYWRWQRWSISTTSSTSAERRDHKICYFDNFLWFSLFSLFFSAYLQESNTELQYRWFYYMDYQKTMQAANISVSPVLSAAKNWQAHCELGKVFCSSILVIKPGKK